MSVVIETIDGRNAALITFTGNIGHDDVRDLQRLGDILDQLPRSSAKRVLVNFDFVPDISSGAMSEIVEMLAKMQRQFQREFELMPLLVVPAEQAALAAREALEHQRLRWETFPAMEVAYDFLERYI